MIQNHKIAKIKIYNTFNLWYPIGAETRLQSIQPDQGKKKTWRYGSSVEETRSLARIGPHQEVDRFPRKGKSIS